MSEEVTNVTITQAPPDGETVSGIAKLEDWANALVIKTAEDRAAAVVNGQNVKRMRKRIEDWFAPSRELAHKAWKSICNQETEITKKLEAIEKKAKGIILAYDSEQERIRQEEMARLQAAADLAAARERDRLAKAASKLKNEELRDQRMAEAQMVTAPVVSIQSVVQKQIGESTRKLWKAKVTDLALVIKSASEGNEVAASMLTIDSTKLGKFATATKGTIKIAGVEFYEEVSTAWRT